LLKKLNVNDMQPQRLLGLRQKKKPPKLLLRRRQKTMLMILEKIGDEYEVESLLSL
jgi:hypothetical protein